MAVVTVPFRSQDIVCSAVHGASLLNGMVWMYVLMSGFHSAPWLKLLSARGDALPPITWAKTSSE